MRFPGSCTPTPSGLFCLVRFDSNTHDSFHNNFVLQRQVLVPMLDALKLAEAHSALIVPLHEVRLADVSAKIKFASIDSVA
mmetsp:Transcript_2032/g.3651  ORF Transcript_2032/g.3651 Transcript_2032/m.3651 type:complete len:81 (-) Transcript_2032:1193-1435(-)